MSWSGAHQSNQAHSDDSAWPNSSVSRRVVESAGTVEDPYRYGSPRARKISKGRTMEAAVPPGSPSSSSSDGSVKQRKPTYQLQKEERDELLEEARLLEARLELLKIQAGLPTVDDDNSVANAQANNLAVEKEIHANWQRLGTFQSLLLRQLQDKPLNPMTTFIHLPRQPAERKAILESLQDTTLRRAQTQADGRLHFLDPTKPYLSEEYFTASDGMYYFKYLEIKPFPSARNAKQLYDALAYFYGNLDISITETMGQLTVREGDVTTPATTTSRDDDVSTSHTTAWHQRLVTQSVGDSLVEELNVVGFSRFSDDSSPHATDGSPCGVFAVDSVDKDDLYPYRPLERIRKDLQAAYTIREYRHPSVDINEPPPLPLVVLKSYVVIALHAPAASLQVSESAVGKLRENLVPWVVATNRFLDQATEVKNRRERMAERPHGSTEEEARGSAGGGRGYTHDTSTSCALWSAPVPLLFAAKWDDSQTDSTSASESGDGDGAEQQLYAVQAAKKKKKSSPTQRQAFRPPPRRQTTSAPPKVEKAALQDEMRTLLARVELLRRRAGLPTIEEKSAVTAAQVENAKMEERIRTAKVALGRMHSMVIRELQSIPASPMATYIHLPRDMRERRAILSAMKPTKLQRAFQVGQSFLYHLDPTKPYAREERYMADDGFFHCNRFEIDQFEGLQSARQLYDAMLFLFGNMEIRVTETLGTLALREDDEDDDPSFWNHRIVSVGGDGYPQELNVVLFTSFEDGTSATGGSPLGLITYDCVDEDDLYPYRPLERTRKDFQSCHLITEYRKPDTQELVVVLRRCLFIAQHPPAFPMPRAAVDLLHANMARWMVVVTKYLRERMAPLKG